MLKRINGWSTRRKAVVGGIGLLFLLVCVGAILGGEPAETCPNAEEKAYFSTMAAISGDAIPNLEGLMQQTGKVSSNPSVLLQNEWIVETGGYLRGLLVYIKDTREVLPPPATSRIHDYNLRAVNAMEEAVQAFVYGVDNLDAESIEGATAGIKEHGRLVEAATTAATRFCE